MGLLEGHALFYSLSSVFSLVPDTKQALRWVDELKGEWLPFSRLYCSFSRSTLYKWMLMKVESHYKCGINRNQREIHIARQMQICVFLHHGPSALEMQCANSGHYILRAL